MMNQVNEKITMNLLFRRNNRNRYFQIVNENHWLGKNNVYTGLGLHKSIMECARLSLTDYSKEFRDDPKNWDLLLNKELQFQMKMCEDIIIGTNKDAKRNSFGKIVPLAGWEMEL